MSTQLSQTLLEEMNLSDVNKLKGNNKDQLLAYIQILRGKVEELQSYQLIAKRVQLLERSQLHSLQYNRRESIEIHGIPAAVVDKDLETYCCEVLGEIGCGEIGDRDVHACHRLRNKDKAIIRFTNRKFANKALHHRKKLKEIDRQKFKIPESSRGLFVNESLCKPMSFLFYKVRSALSAKKIDAYNLWKGSLSIKMNGCDHNISHVDDLIDLGLAEEDDRLTFFK